MYEGEEEEEEEEDDDDEKEGRGYTSKTDIPKSSTISPVGSWPLKGPSMKPQCLNLYTITGGPE
jgi:hypothetical protein